jgi:hypothetical protein
MFAACQIRDVAIRRERLRAGSADQGFTSTLIDSRSFIAR